MFEAQRAKDSAVNDDVDHNEPTNTLPMVNGGEVVHTLSTFSIFYENCFACLRATAEVA